MPNKFYTLYVETHNSPRLSLVDSNGDDYVQKESNDVVYGDTLFFHVRFLDNSVIDTTLNQPDHQLTLGLGNFSGLTYSSSSNWFCSSSYGFTGSLVVSSSLLDNALTASTSTYVESYLTARLRDTGSNTSRTYLQTLTKIYPDII